MYHVAVGFKERVLHCNCLAAILASNLLLIVEIYRPTRNCAG